MATRFRIALTVSLGLLVAAQPAAAQGNGRGNAFGHAKAASVSPPGNATAGGGGAPSQADVTGVRNFGSWLDDASVATPGSGVMSFAAGYWRMAGFTEVDAPSFDVGVGLSRRMQAGASVPVYHAGATGGPVSRGVGDLFLNAKIQLRDPAARQGRVGVAVVPLVQILSAEPAPGSSRVSWALPVALEIQFPGWRAYGCTGYFSRGSLFASLALERPLSQRVWMTGTISQSRSIKADPGADALGWSSNRTDVSGGASWAMSDSLAIFGSMGRTLSQQEPSATRLFATGGLSVNFDAWSR